MNLSLLLEEAAKNFAIRPVLISDGQRVNYDQLNHRVNAIAHLLRQSGVGKGDKVALMLPNIPEFVYCYFAAIKLGAVVVHLNTTSTSHELIYLLENSESKVLITTEGNRKKHEEIRPKLTSCKILVTVDSPDQNAPFKKAIAARPFPAPDVSINPEDPAAIIYTAGLTGKPLGAVLTHRNLYSQSHLIQSFVKRTSDDVGLSLIPLFHSFGSTVNMINVIRTGCSVVMMDRFTMDSLFGAIQKEKITYICAVPRLYMHDVS
jgi:long-chain acyl-CoA synthetase